MPGKIHIPKLTRTACGKKLTDKIRLSTDPIFKRDKVYCHTCKYSEFTMRWRIQIGYDELKWQQRFHTYPDNSLIESISHKKTIEAYQAKGFNV